MTPEGARLSPEVFIPKLQDIIRARAGVKEGGILDVSSFLNQQVDAPLMGEIGQVFAQRFEDVQPTVILTADISGIAPALETARKLGIHMISAKKQRSVVMPQKMLVSRAPSHTKGGETPLIVNPVYLTPDHRVIIIDDFLATGNTIEALIDIIKESGATLVGIGAVIEKSFEGGREDLINLLNLDPSSPEISIISLAIIKSMDPETGEIVFS